MDLPEAQDLDAWIGTQRVDEDVLSSGRARALAATLDAPQDDLADGAILPAGWHWLYFNPAVARSELAPDGHERLGSFLPPVPLPRRMWAGGTLRFPGALRIGEQVRRVSTIRSIEWKQGRSGPLVFVTAHHEISNRAGVAVEEDQNLVYRSRESPVGATARHTAAPTPPPPVEPVWTESYVADEVTLFRFSALTFNGHRIHYDHRYATEVEGYPGLVVHGPLLALLLLGAGVRHAAAAGADARAATSFRYRAAAPLFCNEEFHLAGGGLEAPDPAVEAPPGAALMKLWATHPERGLATEAELDVRAT